MARLFLLAALAFVCLSQCDGAAYRKEVFKAINAARVKNGLKALHPNAELNKDCVSWATKMLSVRRLSVDNDTKVNGKTRFQIVAGNRGGNMQAQNLVKLWLTGSTRPFVLRNDVTTMGFGMAHNDAKTVYKYAAEFQ